MHKNNKSRILSQKNGLLLIESPDPWYIKYGMGQVSINEYQTEQQDIQTNLIIIILLTIITLIMYMYR